jgi:mRNA interferase RelE/StbE
MYKIEISKPAERDLKRLPTALFERIVPEIKALAMNPRPHGCAKLAGSKSDYRIRVGDYRVLYEIADQVRIVRILRVRHRREAYR